MSISSPGIGSGIDISSLVSQLVAAEGSSKSNRLNAKEANFQSEISAFGSLKAALSEFQTSIQSLQDIESFQQRTVISSDTTIFTATADKTAAISNYAIDVVQLAQANKLISQNGVFSSSSDLAGAGTLRFTQGVASFSLTISATDTIGDVRDAINNASENTGISAAIINVDDGLGGTQSKLVFTSTKTGLDNAITVDVDEDLNSVFNDAGDLDANGLSRLINVNLDEVAAALDGQINVDNQLVSSSNDTYSTVIDGVVINAKKVGASESLAVGLDKTIVETKINNFIKSYNDLVDITNSFSAFDAETQSGGVLLGDSTLRSIQSSIRRLISSPVDGLSSNIRTLAELGITTESNGKFSLDSERFSSVLDNNFDEIGNLFASDDGISERLDTFLDGYIGSSGILDSKTEGLQNSIKDIVDQRITLNRRLEDLESRLLRQYSALDTLVNSLQNQSNFLTQQLSNLPGSFNPSNRS